MPLYFLTCVFLFWIPGVALMFSVWRFLNRHQRKGFWRTCGIIAVISFFMEYVYLSADIWSFSEAHDPLLGLTIMGAPIEEFTFWFGASPFILGVYLATQRFAPRWLLVTPPRVSRPSRRRRRRSV